MRRTLALLLALAFVAAPLVATAASASDYDRLFYYRHSDRAFASLKKNYTSIDTLAPQVHTIDGAGNLQGEIDKDVLKFAKKKKIDVMPLVTNGAFNKEVSAAFLANADARALAVSSMVAEAKAKKYVGWQIDFEQIDVSHRDEFSAFIAEAADAFHAENLLISVAVVSKVSDDPADYPGELWTNLIGVFDYEALGGSADFLSIMSYDEPYKTGPVSPFPWLERVLDYTLAKVPAEKISLGVPLYYWERENGTQRIMEIGGAVGVADAKKLKGVKKGYSDDFQTSYLKFKVDGVGRTLWYESAKSMQAKLDLAASAGLGGFSAWALGLELPETHRVFKKWK